MRGELGISKIGGLGYCFGGKYVPRWMTGEGKVDLGFIAHPSFLTEGEIDAVKGGLSIAAGSKFYHFSLSFFLVTLFAIGSKFLNQPQQR